MECAGRYEARCLGRGQEAASHAHMQMARELGLNPSKLGKLDNLRQEPRLAPLPQFIERFYEKRFGRVRPENIMSVEDLARERARKDRARRFDPTNVGAERGTVSGVPKDVSVRRSPS